MTSPLSAILTFSLSLFCLVFGVARLKKQRKIRKTGITTKGYVYQMDGTYPVIKFVTKTNEWIVAKSDTNGVFEKGKTVSVVYNPAKPNEFFLLQFRSIVTPYILIVAGLIAFVFGMLAFVGLVSWHT